MDFLTLSSKNTLGSDVERISVLENRSKELIQIADKRGKETENTKEAW